MLIKLQYYEWVGSHSRIVLKWNESSKVNYITVLVESKLNHIIIMVKKVDPVC